MTEPPSRTVPHSPDPLAARLLAKPRRDGLAGFLDGLGVPWDGYLYLRAHRRLWRYTLVPVFLHLCLSLAILAGVAVLSVSAYGWLGSVFPTGWGWAVAKGIAELALVLALLASGAALALGLAVAVCSVFWTRLAREIELRLGTPAERLKGQGPLADVVEALRNLVDVVLVNALCLLLSFLPMVGIVTPFVSYWCNAFLFGRETMDFVQSVRGVPRAKKRALAKANRATVMGLGTVVLMFNIVPVLGSFCVAPAVAGSVFLYRRLADA